MRSRSFQGADVERTGDREEAKDQEDNRLDPENPRDIPGADLTDSVYLNHGRGEDNAYDCLGIQLELYRREGLKLPDPRPGGPIDLDAFRRLWVRARQPNRFLDAIVFRRGGEESVWTVVSRRFALGTGRLTGGMLRPIAQLVRIPGVRFYRLRHDRLR